MWHFILTSSPLYKADLFLYFIGSKVAYGACISDVKSVFSVYATMYELFHFSSSYSFFFSLFTLIPLLFKAWTNLCFTSPFLYSSYYTSSDI